MNKETHYLHVSYMVTRENGSIKYGDIVVGMFKGSLKELREALLKEINEDDEYKTNKLPVIISMTELSESLYKTLMGE